MLKRNTRSINIGATKTGISFKIRTKTTKATKTKVTKTGIFFKIRTKTLTFNSRGRTSFQGRFVRTELINLEIDQAGSMRLR